MNFLAEHKFDFNTAFSDGVQYLTQEEEKNLKEKHQNSINKLKEQNKNKPAEPEVQNVPDMNKIEDLNVKGNFYFKTVQVIENKLHARVNRHRFPSQMSIFESAGSILKCYNCGNCVANSAASVSQSQSLGFDIDGTFFGVS